MLFAVCVCVLNLVWCTLEAQRRTQFYPFINKMRIVSMLHLVFSVYVFVSIVARSFPVAYYGALSHVILFISPVWRSIFRKSNKFHFAAIIDLYCVP